MLLMFERVSEVELLKRFVNTLQPTTRTWWLYDPNEDTTYLQYLDANNLYGWVMSQSLPTGGFRWATIKPNEICKLVVRADKGYLLEVDVTYPRELHDSHNDLPFMCERMEINEVEKLVPNLHGKKNYVIYIRALDQALSHGLILE